MPNDVIPDTLSFAVSSEINSKKLQNIKHLVQKLTSLNSTHDEAHTDYIASLCENTKPDDRYICKILLALGLLLRDLGSSLTTFQFHSLGHPINTELFLVLEQTKFSNFPKQEPSNKRLLNKENFHRKLIFDTVNEVLAKKTDYDGELPVIALEVERLIFEDLVRLFWVKLLMIVAAIEQFTDLEETTLDEAIGRLKAFEERVNLFNGSPSDNQDKLLFSNHDNSSSHEKGFKNGGQE
nr:protein longifolia 1 [Tanacetum cinerariifolium]